MRIAVVGPTHPIKGGIAQHTTVLAHRLAAAGHTVEIVSWHRQYPQRLYPGEQTVTQPELPPFEPTRRVLSWNRPDSWAREARRLRDIDLVVFTHVIPVQVPVTLTMIAKLRRRGTHSPRVVVLCHNVLPHERRRSDVALVSRLLRAADVVLTHSDEQRDLAASLTDRPVVVAQLPPSMPVGFARRTPEPGEHRRLLFFGLVRPYKGLDVLLRALARGPGDVHLRVAGEVWGGSEPVEALCRELGMADRVELRPGYVEASAVPGLFADVDALVLPYRSATGSQAVWVGFEFGVPVIATRAGSLAADVRDGVDGVIADPDDVDSLVDALDRFYRPGVPERMRADVRPVNPDPYWDRYLAALLSEPASPRVPTSASGREPQLGYSQVQAKMLDEQHRRIKARKILSVLHHYLGAESLVGLSALDIGCSAGFIADELASDGADTTGVDIDEPGLQAARARFGHHVRFVQASGAELPFDDDSFDVIVFNHIYEHVVDPDAVLTEIHRTLKPSGVAYLGLGNKYQVVEPHYRLPFLSWLPQSSADRYVRTFGRANEYYESYRSRAGLHKLVRGFHIWDYTIGVIRRPGLFHSGDQVRSAVARVPAWALRAATPIMPTYIWLATKRGSAPRGVELGSDVEHLDLTDRPR